MSYMTYTGPADVVLVVGDQRIELPGLAVNLGQTHTTTFRLGMLPDRQEREVCSLVEVTLPDGYSQSGPVTYTAFGLLVFTSHHERGMPRAQP